MDMRFYIFVSLSGEFHVKIVFVIHLRTVGIFDMKNGMKITATLVPSVRPTEYSDAFFRFDIL